MAQELVYTSAPKGLKPLSKGFCTVAQTRGMAGSLAEQLESLSDYRPFYPPSSPEAKDNPATYAHWLLPGNLHVLSRVVFAGFDYTARANKLAHHLVLGPGELSPAGPARLFLAPGLFRERWEGAPRWLETPPALPPIEDAPAAPCAAWEAAIGDPGWAGALAMCGCRAPVTVIYPPELDPRPLLDEAVRLFPVDERWAITFCTNFSALPAGFACAWRWCVAGSPAAAAPAGKVIDLTAKRALTERHPFIEAARTGAIPAPAPRARGGAAAPAPVGAAVPGTVTVKKNAGFASSAATTNMGGRGGMAGADDDAAAPELDETIFIERERRFAGVPPQKSHGKLLAALLIVAALAGGGAWHYWQKTQAEQKRREQEAMAERLRQRREQAEANAREEQARMEAAQKAAAELERQRLAKDALAAINAESAARARVVEPYRKRLDDALAQAPDLFGAAPWEVDNLVVDGAADTPLPWLLWRVLTTDAPLTQSYRNWWVSLLQRDRAVPRQHQAEESLKKLAAMVAAMQQEAAKAEGAPPEKLPALRERIGESLTAIDGQCGRLDKQLKRLGQTVAEYRAGLGFFAAMGAIPPVTVRVKRVAAGAWETAAAIGHNEQREAEQRVRASAPDRVVAIGKLRDKGAVEKLATLPPKDVPAGVKAECFTDDPEAPFVPLKLEGFVADPKYKNQLTLSWSSGAAWGATAAGGAGKARLRYNGYQWVAPNDELDAERLLRTRLAVTVNGRRVVIAFK